MIQINKIVPMTCEAFDPQDKSLGFINEYEYFDLRIQVMELQIDGYYLIFNDIKINIESSGNIDRCPIGFFDTIENSLDKLIAKLTGL